MLWLHSESDSRHDQQQYTDSEEYHEDPLPVGHGEQQSAHDGCGDGDDTLHAAQNREEAGQLASRIQVCCYRPRYDQTAGTGETLYEPVDEEAGNGVGGEASGRGGDEGCE